MQQPIDAAARQTALDTTQSFAVTAPAGSGKTGLLTLRVLKLLPLVSLPEEVLCITFTNKAASEMRERIVKAINSAQLLVNDNVSIDTIEDEHQKLLMKLAMSVLQKDKELGWNILENPSRLRILTIDGFCRILSSHIPLDSGLGAEGNIISDPEFTYRQAIGSFFEQLRRDENSETYRSLLSHFDNNANRISDLLVKLLANRDQWLPLVYQSREDAGKARSILQNAMKQWHEDILLELNQVASAFKGECEDLLRYARENTALPDNASDTSELDYFWKPLSKILLTDKGEFRKTLDKRGGFPSSTKEQKAKKSDALALLSELTAIPKFQTLLLSAQSLPPVEYDEQQWNIIETLFDTLPLLTAHLKLIFSQTESTDFIEISQAALSAIHPGAHSAVTNLSLKLDYQISHILIDEFQDTSLPQLRLLEGLVEGWQSHDGKTLFVVGDGMQSCYGFRNANVGLFLQVRRSGISDVHVKPLDLRVNFRSTLEIINWVNRVFIDAFPQEDNISRGAVKYSKSSAFPSTGESNSSADTHIHCTWVTESPEYTAQHTESEFITERIQYLQNEYPDDSLAVLVRSRSDLKTLIPHLNQRGISYEAIEIDPLKSKGYIQDLVSLTKAIMDTSDRISWLALLRAPWCALDFYDLFHLLNTASAPTTDLFEKPKPNIVWSAIKNHASNTDLSQEAHELLDRFTGVMDITLGQRQRRPFATLIEACWNALAGPCSLDKPSQVTDVNRYFQLVTEHEQGGRISNWDRFALGLNRLYAQPNSAGSTLQLMTMHKSKGLEFDSVFIPSTERSPRSEDQAILYWHERINTRGATDLFLTPIGRLDSPTKDPLTKFIQLEKKEKALLEQTRLFYVACTRAKKRLYLTAKLKADSEGQPKPPTKNSMLGQIWPTVQNELVTYESKVQPETLETERTVNASPNLLARIPLNWSVQHNWPQRQLDDDTSEQLVSSTSDTLTEFNNKGFNVFEESIIGGRVERAAGTVFHRILKTITQVGAAHYRLKDYIPTWRIQLKQLGLEEEPISQELVRMEECLNRMLSEPLAQWILDNTHQDSQCELEIRFGSQPKLLIVDRTFIEDGVRWIVDYKTTQLPENMGAEDFMTRERDKYSAQLMRYASVLQTLDTECGLKLNYKLALYFPYLGELSLLNTD